MLDSYHNFSYPSRIDVHQHQAPTAETAKLLSELEKEAKDRVLAAHHFSKESNGIAGDVIFFYNPVNDTVDVVISTTINDQKIKVEDTINKMDLVLDGQEAFKRLLNTISEKITMMLAARIAKGLFKS